MTRGKAILLFVFTSLIIFAAPLTVSARGHGGGHHRANAGVNCLNNETCLARQANQTQQQVSQPQEVAPADDTQQPAADAVQPQQRIRQRDQQCDDAVRREDCPYRAYCDNQNENGGAGHRHNWRRNPGCRLAPAES
ncbi:hypothetical protein ACWN8V_13340 [Vagococcus elongatus]|uniref:Secreted protein n=1 Tax=Vagococcus elongatus TaxID=180344 RepID=A0A430AL96_9ENTE|nr:hypothetical protein [Vagococcus elongatus]RSU08856.1 hypothetical protein CBF29_13105 [Vagococcus elongatus]